ncbi:unnamed protein product [Ectocarpus fasciculatus]
MHQMISLVAIAGPSRAAGSNSIHGVANSLWLSLWLLLVTHGPKIENNHEVASYLGLNREKHSIKPWTMRTPSKPASCSRGGGARLCRNKSGKNEERKVFGTKLRDQATNSMHKRLSSPHD